jgi:prepilin-type N-terminal cleavage/methylation domain-containing protein
MNRIIPKAFTLAENLVALAVLGLILAITIPTVLHSTNDLVMKARMKEGIISLQEGHWQLVSSGYEGSMIDGLVSKLQARRVCPNNSLAEKCQLSNLGEANQPGLVLPSDVVINGLDSEYSITATTAQHVAWNTMAVIMTTKPTETVSIHLVCATRKRITPADTPLIAKALKPGECGPVISGATPVTSATNLQDYNTFFR